MAVNNNYAFGALATELIRGPTNQGFIYNIGQRYPTSPKDIL